MSVRVFWTAPLIGAQVFAGPIEGFATREIVAPPTPPPIEHREAGPAEGRLHSAATVYSIGDPTPEEQLYVEFINRSRANPQAEAQLFATSTDANVVSVYDFFNLDLVLMQQQFAALPAVSQQRGASGGAGAGAERAVDCGGAASYGRYAGEFVPGPYR